MSFGYRTGQPQHQETKIILTSGSKGAQSLNFMKHFPLSLTLAKVALNKNEILSVNVIMRLHSSFDITFNQLRWPTCGPGLMH